jgi:aromatic ring hydroxylase
VCRTFFSDTKHNDKKNISHKIGRQSVSNDVVDDVSSNKTIQIKGVTAMRNVKSDLGESTHSQELKEALNVVSSSSAQPYSKSHALPRLFVTFFSILIERNLPFSFSINISDLETTPIILPSDSTTGIILIPPIFLMQCFVVRMS